MRFLILFAAMLAPASTLADCTVRSSDTTAALVELYTSEGCSSCPPADRWLSTFVNPLGTRRVVPLAFHVSYWDYIGWKDAYADERHTERQRALATATGARMVYTPQVMIAGRDFRGWTSERAVAEAVEAVNRQPARAQIEIVSRPPAEGGAAGVASVTLRPGVKADDVALLVAVTQNGLSSRVTAGENRGEKLSHSFAVRDFAVIRNLQGAFSFRPKPDWNLAQMSLVAFVQNLKTGEVLQALSAPLCRS